jgi:formylglycine-generating enzyme
MNMTRTAKIATTAMLAVLWMHACGGKTSGEQQVAGTGGSGHDASVGGSGGTTGKGGTAGKGGMGGSAGFDGCPGLGCAPNCGDAGVAVDENGCPTCTCDPMPDGGIGGSDGSMDGTSGAGGGAGTCPGTGGPTMVMLPPGYCIDSTEVTRDQYAAWLTTNPSTSGQDAWCAWNTDFTPDATCMAASYVCQGTGCENHPQVCVDWCDAHAYCKAMGKRLCGKIGGGPDDSDFWVNSQWINACTSGVDNAYPYGDTYDGQACNGWNYWTSQDAWFSATTVEVGSLSGCQSSVSGYAGVFDLSGNAYEWIDWCVGIDGQNDFCHLRGGSINDSDYSLRCLYDTGNYRNHADGKVGVRCCSP